MSPEQVPAPQLASPAGAAFGAAAFFVAAVGDLLAPVDAGDEAVGAGAAGAVAAVAAEGGVEDAPTVGRGAPLGEVAAGMSDFAPDALPEQPLAEHEA